MANNANYAAGARKPWGAEVSCNEFHGLDPSDLPKAGDWVEGRRVAHELIEVIPSRTKPDTVRYRARRWPIDKIPQGVKVYSTTSNLQLGDY